MRNITEIGERQYRRGAILGLTVAETFMLIAFALLLLLWLWRSEAHEQFAEVAGFEALAAEERTAVLDLLADGGIEWVLTFKDAGVRIGSPDMDGGAETLAARLKLLEERDLMRLVDAASVWRGESRRKLVELVSLGSGEQSLSDILALLEEGLSPDDIRAALAIAEALDPEEIGDVETLRARIRSRLEAGEARQNQLRSAVHAALGPLVARVDGRIEETGAIVLPDELLFAQGSAEITSRLQRFLEEACMPWLKALRALHFEIDEIRIEGHASSEWGPQTSPEEAYFNNLSLSQDRSKAVLERCLRLAGDSETGLWARQRATAVGYSSSRPVLAEAGNEDAPRSRRVVFSAIVRSADVIAEIGAEVAPQGNDR